MSLSDKFRVSITAPPHRSESVALAKSLNEKPLGAFPTFERFYLKMAAIRGERPSLSPQVKHLLFYGDHGIAATASAKEAEGPDNSGAQILDFLQGHGPLGQLNNQAPWNSLCVSLAVDFPFERHWSYWMHRGSKLLHLPMAAASENFLEYPALSSAQTWDAMRIGARLAAREIHHGAEALVFSARGLGQAASAICLWAALEDVDPRQGLSESDRAWAQNARLNLDDLAKALRRHPKSHDPQTLLTFFGGFETAALSGAMLKAAELQVPLILEGLASLSIAHWCQKQYPLFGQYCFLTAVEPNYWNREMFKSLELSTAQQMELGLDYPPGLLSARLWPLWQAAHEEIYLRLQRS